MAAGPRVFCDVMRVKGRTFHKDLGLDNVVQIRGDISGVGCVASGG